MNQRDDDFARLAAEYAAADADVIGAERMANQAAVKASAARADRENLKKKLAGFVGANVRTRNVVVGFKLVRAEWRNFTSGETAEVSVEDVTISRGGRMMNWLRQLWASLVRRHLVAPDPHPEPVPPWVYDAAPPERYRLRVCPACGGTAVAGLAHVCAGRVVAIEDDGDPA